MLKSYGYGQIIVSKTEVLNFAPNLCLILGSKFSRNRSPIYCIYPLVSCISVHSSSFLLPDTVFSVFHALIVPVPFNQFPYCAAFSFILSFMYSVC